MHERMAIKDSANFGRSQREAKMARRTSVNGVDGKAAGLIGRFSEKMCLKRHVLSGRMI
jgi:hypothetical protein